MSSTQESHDIPDVSTNRDGFDILDLANNLKMHTLLYGNPAIISSGQ
jgi:hypothetical protein